MKDGVELLGSKDVQLCNPGNLKIFMNYGFSQNPYWAILPSSWPEIVTLFVAQSKDVACDGDSTQNGTTLELCKET